MIQATLSVHGTRIKYRIRGKVQCSRMEREIPNSRTYEKTDGIWANVFGSRAAVETFVRQGRTLTMKIDLGALGYDPCDHVC